MNKKQTILLALIIPLLATLLAACGPSAKETPVPTAEVTVTPAVILTSGPTATLTPEPPAAPTITPLPSPTTTPTPENIVSRIWEKDGMEQVFVPAGEFSMGHVELHLEPVRTVYLDAYWIDKTEITNAWSS